MCSEASAFSNSNLEEKIALSFVIIVVYSLFFFLGGLDAPDRSNYVAFFDDPSVNSFEPLFVYYGFFLNFIGINSFFSVYFTGLVSVMFSMLLVSSFYLNSIYYFCVSFFFMFVSFSMFTFVQVSASFAMWFSVYFFISMYNYSSFYQSILFLFLVLFSVFMHYAMILFLFVCFYHFLFKKISFFEFFLVSLFCILFYFKWEYFFYFLGVEGYYSQYFESFKNDLMFSPFVLTYFMVCTSLVVMSFNGLFCYNRMLLFHFSMLAFPIVFLAYVTGFDIFVKLSAPFMVLSYILFFDGVYSVFKKLSGEEFIYFFFLISPVFVFYSYFSYWFF